MADVWINSIFYLKYDINVDKYRPRGIAWTEHHRWVKLSSYC